MLTPSQISTLSALIESHCTARCAVSNYSAESDGPVEKYVSAVTNTGEALDKWLKKVEIPERLPAKIEEFRGLLQSYREAASHTGRLGGLDVDEGKLVAIEHQLLAAIAQLLNKSDD